MESLPARKERTAAVPIGPLEPPRRVVLPLSQHIGVPCEPVVEVGDRVKVGEVVGDTPAPMAAPVHASISGRVVQIADLPHPRGGVSPAVVIESDGTDDRIDPAPVEEAESATPERLRAAIRGAGIVGLAGAAFPTAAKLDPPSGATIDLAIVNVMEGEPYLSADHRVALEYPDEVIDGLGLIMRIVGAPRGVLAVEEDKEDAAHALDKALAESGLEAEVVLIPRDYAAGAEKVLIKLITGREIPSGGLPYDVGVVSQNVSTTASISRAIRRGVPLVERVVTVAGGAVERPGNYLIRIGTPFEDVLRATGTRIDEVARLVMGGPMMGIAQPDTSAPVIKPTTGLLALTADEVRGGEEVPCIHCAYCVEVCPLGLMPFLLVDLVRMNEPAIAAAYHLADCFECGLCDYVCPSNIPLVSEIHRGKLIVREAAR